MPILWFLPAAVCGPSPCSVTVQPKNHRSFWEAVGLRALQQDDWDLLERLGMPRGGALRVEEAVQVDSAEFSLVPEGPLPTTGGVDPQDIEGPQAFPVFKAVPCSGLLPCAVPGAVIVTVARQLSYKNKKEQERTFIERNNGFK